MTNEIMEKLKQASNNLIMVSESDYPFETFLWVNQAENLTSEKLLELTNHPQETLIEIVELEHFFRNCAQEKEWHDEKDRENVKSFQTLIKTLEANLIDIKVYRIGTVNIDVYIVGKTLFSDLAGISTKVVET